MVRGAHSAARQSRRRRPPSRPSRRSGRARAAARGRTPQTARRARRPHTRDRRRRARGPTGGRGWAARRRGSSSEAHPGVGARGRRQRRRLEEDIIDRAAEALVPARAPADARRRARHATPSAGGRGGRAPPRPNARRDRCRLALLLRPRRLRAPRQPSSPLSSAASAPSTRKPYSSERGVQLKSPRRTTAAPAAPGAPPRGACTGWICRSFTRPRDGRSRQHVEAADEDAAPAAPLAERGPTTARRCPCGVAAPRRGDVAQRLRRAAHVDRLDLLELARDVPPEERAAARSSQRRSAACRRRGSRAPRALGTKSVLEILHLRMPTRRRPARRRRQRARQPPRAAASA